MIQMPNKILHLIQPGKIGDVIICLPIAKEYFDRGYEVNWYINKLYAKLFDYVDYVKPVILRGNLNQNIQEAHNIISVTYFGKGLLFDLAIGFSHHKETITFLKGNRHFDEWKYNKAGIDINRKYKLVFNRNRIKEVKLKKYLGIKEGESYKVIHQSSSHKKYSLGINGIEVRPIGNFTLFDWYSILKNAEEIYCVDSCVANFVNQLGFCVGRRYIKFWKKYKTPMLNPTLKKDWIVL